MISTDYRGIETITRERRIFYRSFTIPLVSSPISQVQYRVCRSSEVEVVNLRDPKIIRKGKEAIMFGLIDRVRRQRSESCTKVPERREYDDSGMPIPQCEAEKLQMRFHMTPRLHAAIPGGLHNN